MAFDESTDLTPGRASHAVAQAKTTLRDDTDLVDWLGGDPDAIIDGHGSGDVPSRALAVEDVVSGSTQSGTVERSRITVQVTPLVARSVYRAEPDRYLSALRDRAIEVLRRDGIGPGYRYLGSTDDLAFPEPQTADDIDAVMQHMGRVQFVAELVANDLP
jgi:hypothetical protein